MALLLNRAVTSIQPNARQLLFVFGSRAQGVNLPCTTQIAPLSSTHGQPAKRKHSPWPYKTRRYNELFQFFDHTRKRFDDNTKIILIDGNIACGKSWLGKKIAEEFDMKFYPDPKDTEMFIMGDGLDVRSLNERLPARSGFCDLETFYSQAASPALLNTFPRTLLSLYYHHFMNYVDALEHVLNTGQGVVMERSVFSHMVFHNVLRKMGYLSAGALKYLNLVYDNTVCEMWRPHALIYMDAPVEFIRSMINKRNVEWEAKSPVITDQFLTQMDKVFKEKYLPYMSKYGEVIRYDITDLPDWEIMVEELESLDLDNPPFDNEDKFKDWQSEFEDDYNLMRMNLGKKYQVQNLFTIPAPWDVPEMMIHEDDLEVHRQRVLEHPEIKYAKGYNPEKGSVLFKW